MSFKPLAVPAARVVDDLTARLQRDAEELAAEYNYDADALQYQYDRRCFGSFCTTLAGSPGQRDRFFRAWLVALKRQQARAQAAE